jgi:hypothetical protein
VTCEAYLLAGPAPRLRHGCRVHAVPGAWLGHPCSMNRAAGGGPLVTAVRRERTSTKGHSQTGTPRSQATQAKRHRIQLHVLRGIHPYALVRVVPK